MEEETPFHSFYVCIYSSRNNNNDDAITVCRLLFNGFALFFFSLTASSNHLIEAPQKGAIPPSYTTSATPLQF